MESFVEFRSLCLRKKELRFPAQAGSSASSASPYSSSFLPRFSSSFMYSFPTFARSSKEISSNFLPSFQVSSLWFSKSMKYAHSQNNPSWRNLTVAQKEISDLISLHGHPRSESFTFVNNMLQFTLLDCWQSSETLDIPQKTIPIGQRLYVDCQV